MWIKCNKCGAINTGFSEKCHYCNIRLDTGDGVITSDNTGNMEIKNGTEIRN